jgi:hypothetical protein
VNGAIAILTGSFLASASIEGIFELAQSSPTLTGINPARVLQGGQ